MNLLDGNDREGPIGGVTLPEATTPYTKRFYYPY
jgi:hypothetical protein